MSAEITTGGPAFPIPGLQQHEEFNGMTLRDYFAAKAMQGLLAAPATDGVLWVGMAYAAYDIADAMLKARSE